MMRKILTLSFCLIVPFITCAQGKEGIADSNNIFAFKLFKELQKDNSTIFYSPYSISLALAMTYTGARNGTEKEMSQTLDFRADKKSFNQDFKVLNDKIDSLGLQDGVKLTINNSIWLEKDFKLLPTFTDVLNTFYNAETKEVDYVDNSEREKAVNEINEWVEQKTNDKIKHVLSEDDVNNLTRLILVNTIYFKCNWSRAFDRAYTKKDTFLASREDKEQVEFMNITDRYNYYKDSLLQVIEIPYFRNKLSMIILISNNGDSIHNMEVRMDNEYYTHIIKSFNASGYNKQRVQLSLPKFKTTARFQLKDALSDMGMPSAFIDVAADFSGITGDKELHISKVIHQAYIDVSEEGTEAAAATAISMVLTSNGFYSKPPIILKIDHPFMFIIKDNATGSILFMGKITNPNAN